MEGMRRKKSGEDSSKSMRKGGGRDKRRNGSREDRTGGRRGALEKDAVELADSWLR